MLTLCFSNFGIFSLFKPSPCTSSDNTVGFFLTQYKENIKTKINSIQHVVSEIKTEDQALFSFFQEKGLFRQNLTQYAGLNNHVEKLSSYIEKKNLW